MRTLHTLLFALSRARLKGKVERLQVWRYTPSSDSLKAYDNSREKKSVGESNPCLTPLLMGNGSKEEPL